MSGDVLVSKSEAEVSMQVCIRGKNEILNTKINTFRKVRWEKKRKLPLVFMCVLVKKGWKRKIRKTKGKKSVCGVYSVIAYSRKKREGK